MKILKEKTTVSGKLLKITVYKHIKGSVYFWFDLLKKKKKKHFLSGKSISFSFIKTKPTSLSEVNSSQITCFVVDVKVVESGSGKLYRFRLIFLWCLMQNFFYVRTVYHGEKSYINRRKLCKRNNLLLSKNILFNKMYSSYGFNYSLGQNNTFETEL